MDKMRRGVAAYSAKLINRKNEQHPIRPKKFQVSFRYYIAFCSVAPSTTGSYPFKARLNHIQRCWIHWFPDGNNCCEGGHDLAMHIKNTSDSRPRLLFNFAYRRSGLNNRLSFGSQFIDAWFQNKAEVLLVLWEALGVLIFIERKVPW